MSRGDDGMALRSNEAVFLYGIGVRSFPYLSVLCCFYWGVHDETTTIIDSVHASSLIH